MSTPLRNAQPGDLAYEYGKPSRAGVVVAVAQRGYLEEVTFVMPTGEEITTVNAQSLDELIAEHEKKLSTHKAKQGLLALLRTRLRADGRIP